MKLKPKAYMAGPLGFSEAGRAFHYEVLIPLIETAGYDILDPWKLTEQEKFDNALSLPLGEERNKKLHDVSMEAGGNNENAIHQADLIVAVLDGQEVDSGTAAEVGCAAALHKCILGYRNDFRKSGENDGCIINMQVQYFIESVGGRICNNLQDLKMEAEKIKSALE